MIGLEEALNYTRSSYIRKWVPAQCGSVSPKYGASCQLDHTHVEQGSPHKWRGMSWGGDTEEIERGPIVLYLGMTHASTRDFEAIRSQLERAARVRKNQEKYENWRGNTRQFD